MEDEQKALVTNDESVKSFANYRSNSNVEVGTFSNIKDRKKLFNLQSHVDCMLNDCVGEKLRIKEVLIRRFKKPLAEPIINEETGDVKDSEISVSCVLVDENGKSYATGSKTFCFNLINFLSDFDGEKELAEGLEIEIIKVPTSSGNKALSFQLL